MSDFEEMLEQEIPRLRRDARALTRNPAAANDLVQSTLVRALAKRHLWQPGTNLRHWLFTILHNQRVSELRSLIREQRALGDGPDLDGQISLLELDRAIAALPEARRRVVLLIGLEGVTYNEAATTLGLPVGTIRSRLARARRTLRKTFYAETGVAKPVLAKYDVRCERMAA
jgi:RNA polymerase sigma-70 factor, ECF subfamily